MKMGSRSPYLPRWRDGEFAETITRARAVIHAAATDQPLCGGVLDERVLIARILDRQRRRRHPQRRERVGHDGQLVGPGHADRLLVAAGVRAVRYAHRVARDAARAHAATRREVTVAIEDDLVAVGRAVGVRARDGFGVKVEG